MSIIKDAPTEWKRVARPQSDEYDTNVVLSYARRLGLTLPSISPDEPRLIGTDVAVRSGLSWDPKRYVSVAANHRKIKRGMGLLSTWKDGHRQATRVLAAVYVVSDRASPAQVWGGTSGIGPLGFGTIGTTMDCPGGFAQAIVHEMAHHKLRGLGVGFTSSTNLVTNDPSELCQSPIRYDCLRPMTAVLHAQYSFTYVTELNIHIIRSATSDEGDRAAAGHSLARDLSKLEFGMNIIDCHVRLDAAGRDFMKGFSQWLADTLDTGHEVLNEVAIAPVSFVHPLNPIKAAAS